MLTVQILFLRQTSDSYGKPRSSFETFDKRVADTSRMSRTPDSAAKKKSEACERAQEEQPREKPEARKAQQ